jgi:alpha-glucosidase
MKRLTTVLMVVAAAFLGSAAWSNSVQEVKETRPTIRIVDPPEQGFYSKVLDFHGISIKAHLVVSDEALYAAYDRLSLQLKNLPMVIANLAAAGAELHIIGRNQVTTDLPEWRQDKHVPLDEYNGLTRDQRTRGMGGRITSCGEENLLRLPKEQDRYFGRDICLHEFAHNIQGFGINSEVRARIDDQARKSKKMGLWLNSYAGSNSNEFFAELIMWYFGTHGDLSMTGLKPENGPEGLKKYDPDAYQLLDDFYSGRIEITKVEPRVPRPPGDAAAPPAPRVPRDSLVARSIVAKLTAYKIGGTKIGDFFGDAGMTGLGDEGENGWHVSRLDAAGAQSNAGAVADSESAYRFRINFRDPGNRDHSIADLDFRAGVLVGFKWNN